jgi:regulator of RNase E activity RraA
MSEEDKMKAGDMKRPTAQVIERFRQMESVCQVSDAMDKLGINGTAKGIFPLVEGVKIVGPAITARRLPKGFTKPRAHPTAHIDIAKSGDVIVIDCGARIECSAWGELFSGAAKKKGIEGVVIDGAARDIPYIRKLKFPLFARTRTPTSGKMREMTYEVNTVIQCGGVQVRPGDLVAGDDTGVVIVPKEKISEVLKTVTEIRAAEKGIRDEVSSGARFTEIHDRYDYAELSLPDKEKKQSHKSDK